MVLARKKYQRVLLARLFPEVAARVGHPRNIRPPYTLKYMESVLSERGYSNMLIDCWTRHLRIEELQEETMKFSPEVIIMSVTTPDARESFDYASRIKKLDNNVLIGAVGQDPTAIPERYIHKGSPIDFILKGESELSLACLLDELCHERDFRQVSGFHSLEHQGGALALIEDLDRLPYPKYSERDFNRYRFFYPIKIRERAIWGHLLTSRGCPYGCIFCSQTIRESYGKDLRLRSADNVLGEMKYLINMGANVISIDDDNFTTSREHVYAICGAIKKSGIKIKWTAHARIDNVDVALLKEMKESGCVLLRFGIESGSDRILRIIGKSGYGIDWIERSQEVFSNMKEVGIGAGALFLIGNPTETKEEIRETITLAKKLKPDFAQVCFFTVFPGSEAYHKYKGRTEGLGAQGLYHYAKPRVNLSFVPTEELVKLQDQFYSKIFINPGFFFKHIFNYFLFYIFNMDIFLSLCTLLRYVFRKRSFAAS